MIGGVEGEKVLGLCVCLGIMYVCICVRMYMGIV